MFADLKDAGFANAESTPAKGWEAKLELGFRLRNEKTVLAHRRHYGPLTVQRPFYPEGGVCHVYVLHPPGGIVAGDHLSISADAAAHSHALITTPAAGKCYRSTGEQAVQTVSIKVATGAALEWLPQETIIYQGAHLKSVVKVELAAGARFIGWEMMSLGRPACNERFDVGFADMSWQIYCRDQLLFLERLHLDAKAFATRWGLQGLPACGSLFASPASAESLSAIQQLIGDAKGRGVTRIDNLLVCRALDSRNDLLRGFLNKSGIPCGRIACSARSVNPEFGRLNWNNTMQLTPREKDKLLIFTAGLLAERRKARGLKLNYPEAVAYISAAIIEGARDGRTVAEMMEYGRTLLSHDDVMDGISDMLPEVQVEATFPDGTKLVTVHNPIES